jgi:hypothetical protein
MTVYGDSGPEDAWHPDDPVPVLLDNLARRCARLGEPLDIGEWLADIAAALERIRRRPLSELDQVLAELIAEDIEHVRGRIDG